jgi:hypothetical protein
MFDYSLFHRHILKGNYTRTPLMLGVSRYFKGIQHFVPKNAKNVQHEERKGIFTQAVCAKKVAKFYRLTSRFDFG